jgi:formylglycine-generating enzyme required for sulfatase activity
MEITILNKKFQIIVFFLILQSLFVYSQNDFITYWYGIDSTDLTARNYSNKDADFNVCALIEIKTDVPIVAYGDICWKFQFYSKLFIFVPAVENYSFEIRKFGSFTRFKYTVPETLQPGMVYSMYVTTDSIIAQKEKENQKAELPLKNPDKRVYSQFFNYFLEPDTTGNMVLIEGGYMDYIQEHLKHVKTRWLSYYDVIKEKKTKYIPSFYMCKYEVTNIEFLAFLNDYKSQTVKNGTDSGRIIIYKTDEKYKGQFDRSLDLKDSVWRIVKGYEQHPVTDVSWFGAREYCRWLSKKTGKKYRIPSKHEWEYAARGGKHDSTIYFGTNNKEEISVYRWTNIIKVKQVGLKKPNILGLHDMGGNAMEWCLDSPLRAKIFRVLKGGCFKVSESKITYDDSSTPATCRINTGFRIMCEAD